MYSDSILFNWQIPYTHKKIMNGDFCPYFVFKTEVATAWGYGFAGEFICLNIQPTILQPVQEVSVFHQNVLSVVKGLVFLDVTITSDVQ